MFKENDIFSMKKIVISTLAQVFFALDKYLTAFANQHLGNTEGGRMSKVLCCKQYISVYLDALIFFEIKFGHKNTTTPYTMQSWH